MTVKVRNLESLPALRYLVFYNVLSGPSLLIVYRPYDSSTVYLISRFYTGFVREENLIVNFSN